MHYKTKNKLKTAIKIYTVEPVNGKVTEIKVQLPEGKYVEFDLNLPFPNTVSYKSLSFGGFNYDPEIDTQIIHDSATEVIKKLRNSISYKSNNRSTIEDLITLIKTMSPII
jgi:hypothetical protein